MSKQETAKRSDLIDLAAKMIQRYSGEGVRSYLCPICQFSDSLFKHHRCENCFNRSNQDNMESWLGCTTMFTFSLPDRIEYWKEVLKYLETLTTKNIFLGQLRYQCNQIDQKLGA